MRWFSMSIAALGLAAVAAPAAAADTIWFNGSDANASAGSGDRYFTNGDVTVRVSAWSIDYDGTIRAAGLGMWDYGLGVQHYSNDGNHTVDNNGWDDFLLFQFDQDVEIENGYFWSDWDGLHDTDATIGYGDSPIAFTTAPPLTGLSFASTLGGLTRYLSADNSGDDQSGPGDPLDSSYRNINAGNAVGDVWLVGAAFSNPDRQLDGFKFKALTYNLAPPPPAVPEPSTWAMLILGFGTVGAAMRQRRSGRPATA